MKNTNINETFTTEEKLKILHNWSIIFRISRTPMKTKGDEVYVVYKQFCTSIPTEAYYNNINAVVEFLFNPVYNYILGLVNEI